MSYTEIKALTFDTGGTILDWHTGFTQALTAVGAGHGIERDYASIANQLRRKSLGAMINLGEHEPPGYNIDEAHRTVLDTLLEEHGLQAFSDEERHSIAYTAAHNFS